MRALLLNFNSKFAKSSFISRGKSVVYLRAFLSSLSAPIKFCLSDAVYFVRTVLLEIVDSFLLSLWATLDAYIKKKNKFTEFAY